jgi:hypothetical protein
MHEKRLLVRDRVRRPPRSGFSWVDRRFIREHAPSLGRDAILLYFFLAAVSDKEGLSYWSDGAAASRLKLDSAALVFARRELIARGLIAYERPLTQVLSLEAAPLDRRDSLGPSSLGEMLREILRPPASQGGTSP